MSVIRVCLHSLIILGVVGLHAVAIGDTSGGHEHSSVVMASAEHADTSSSSTSLNSTAVDPGEPSPVTGMTDCCGALMLCIAAGIVLGVALLGRRRAGERILWQLPPPHLICTALAIAPFNPLTPLQRTSILRR